MRRAQGVGQEPLGPEAGAVKVRLAAAVLPSFNRDTTLPASLPAFPAIRRSANT